MNLFTSVKDKFEEISDKRREEKARLDAIRAEAEEVQRIEFEKNLRMQMIEVAKRRAMKDAAKKSGLAKIRAMEKAERLKDRPVTDLSSKLAKFSEYTARNRERTEKNKEITAKKMNMIKQMREEKLALSKQKRNMAMMKRGRPIPMKSSMAGTPGRRPFQPSGFQGNLKRQRDNKFAKIK